MPTFMKVTIMSAIENKELAPEMMNAIMSMSWTDLADKPEFPELTTGAHMLTLQEMLVIANKNGLPMFSLEVQYDALIEGEEGKEAPMAAGDKFKKMFNMMDKDGKANAFSQGELKLILGAINRATGAATMADMQTNVPNLQLVWVVKAVPRKDDATKLNSNIIAVHTVDEYQALAGQAA